MSRLAAGLAIALVAAAWSERASAEERRYALIVGFNGAPSGEGTETPPPLRFADDDALAFYELRIELGDEAILLASPDADTRRRYPRSVDAARPPTLGALDAAVAHLADEMKSDVRAGRSSVFSFFYSGHGTRRADGEAALTLLDASFSRQMLYERILDRIPAGVIHLFVDACHAEAVVRPRDGNAAVVPLSSDDVATYLSQATLRRYRQVGIAVASSEEAASHEWDLYESGVFTHELLSALRGAADVNGDGRVEYSELAAFLSAANREVQDPRARLQAIVQAPAFSPRVPIVDLAQAIDTGRLTRIPAAPASFTVEDTLGNRLADGRPEAGASMSIWLPANRRLYVRRGAEEAELTLRSGTEVRFDSLPFRPIAMSARGALESSLRAGLFLTPFGPAYYSGYVDRQETVSVPVVPTVDLLTESPGKPPARGRRSVVRASLYGAAIALVASSAVFAGMSWNAWRDNQNAVQRTSVDASGRFESDTAWAAGFLVSGLGCAAWALLLGRDP